MKRLWVRLSMAAAVLAGGGGSTAYYVYKNAGDGVETAQAETKPAGNEQAGPAASASPIPVPGGGYQADDGFSVARAGLQVPTTDNPADNLGPPPASGLPDDTGDSTYSIGDEGSNYGGAPPARGFDAQAPYAPSGAYSQEAPEPQSGSNGGYSPSASFDPTAPYDPTGAYDPGSASVAGVGDTSPTTATYADSGAPPTDPNGFERSVADSAPPPSYGDGGTFGAGAAVGAVAGAAGVGAAIAAGAAGDAAVPDHLATPYPSGADARYGQAESNDPSVLKQPPAYAGDQSPGDASAFGQAAQGYGSEASRGQPPAATTGQYNAGPSNNTISEPTGFGTPTPMATPGALSSQTGRSGSSSAPVNADLVLATPGARQLEGQQTPSILLEKTAPPEIQVGKAAIFKILVRNVGQATAHGVVITDRVPDGTSLIDAAPQPTASPDGALSWQVGSLEPNEDLEISIELMPQSEGEIGSVAQVSFQAQAAVRTVCTKPELMIEHTGPETALIGEEVVFSIQISNPGSGAATGVVLEEDVPQGLRHAAGKQLEYEVGTLRPGETRPLELVLTADSAGVVKNRLRLRGEGNLTAEHTATLEVVAPKLQVGVVGPNRRYLDRQVTYEVAIANPGTAAANNVDLIAYLPKGLKFVSTDKQGQYDSKSHSVAWGLERLQPSESGTVQLTGIPTETGDQKLRIEGTADLGLAETYEHTTVVEGITELEFTVGDTQDPIEVGSKTSYEIRVTNTGSKAAANVRLQAVLPQGVEPLEGDGPTRVVVQGQQVIMDPLARLAPNEDAVYRVKVKGHQAGDHVFNVQLTSDDSPNPVIKQESTKVYTDG